MKQIKKPQDLFRELEKLRGRGAAIGFVPTMGCLHEGHLSLIRASKKENQITVASIFVNPLQFGPQEDFNRYPRPLGRDLSLLAKEKTDFIFTPEPRDMYPDHFGTVVEEGALFHPQAKPFWMTRVLCGYYRPGHFKGVMTVVAKLFNIVRPHRAYFGAKDYQQAKIIERMVRDLDWMIDVRILPTVREKDGLAMSSRNQYLKPEERLRAQSLSRVLFSIRDKIQQGERDLPLLLHSAKEALKRSVDELQYLEAVNAETLVPVTQLKGPTAVLTACFVGKTRLIDNVIIRS